MLPLRPYQSECIDAIKSFHAKGIHRQLVSLPTAAGKTVIFAHLIAQKKCRALVIVPSCELLQQTTNKIKMIDPSLQVGIVNSDYKQFNAQVVVCSFQAAIQPNNLIRLSEQNFDLLIWDESHHLGTHTARHVLDSLGFGKGTKQLLIGFTATAFRNDGKGLGEVFDKVVYERNTTYMIDKGWLCPPIASKIKTDLDLSKVETSNSDYQEASLVRVMNTTEMNNIVVDAFQKNAERRTTIVFGVNVDHAKNLSHVFLQRGYKASVVYGEMHPKERDKIISDYKNGEIQVLINCQILTEGFDAPNTDCIIVARPTKSRGLYQQMVGRGLRLYPNKRDCLVLDFCDVNHTLCSVAVLYKDFDDEQASKKQKTNLYTPFIPPNLNQKLKSVLVAYDPLGKTFAWEKDDKSFVMHGKNGIRLEIKQQREHQYYVLFFNGKDYRVLAKNLSFEYAFGVAEAFAKRFRRYFVINDLEAEWREMPITDKQIKIFKSHGFRAGIEHLTRGQASLLIGGVFNRKSSNV